MLIFDSFSSRKSAKDFAEVVRAKFKLRCGVYDSQEDSDLVDPFPFTLEPPIVLVERTFDDLEADVENEVGLFNGVFAGS